MVGWFAELRTGCYLYKYYRINFDRIIQLFFSQHGRDQGWQLILASGQSHLFTCFAENKKTVGSW